MRDSYRKAMDDISVKEEEELTKDINDAPEASGDVTRDYSTCFSKDEKAYVPMDIPQIAREADKRKVDEDSEDGDEPYVISPEDFYESQNNEKVTLTYFEQDEVFMGIDEEVVPDGLELIGGDENLSSIGTYEEDVVYIRNNAMGTDYEIIKDSGSYAMYAGE